MGIDDLNALPILEVRYGKTDGSSDKLIYSSDNERTRLVEAPVHHLRRGFGASREGR